jgi:hypothetical protein
MAWNLNRWFSKASWLVMIALLALPCLAVTPVVKVVPWVPTDPTAPHDTYAGKSITLKGTSDVQGPTIQYTWDFGDGSPNAVGTVTNMYVVEATHVYAGAVGTNWTAKLTIADTSPGGGSMTVNYPVAMRDNNLASNVNVAIDEGLWYLHKTMRRTTVGMTTFGDWLSGSGFTISGAYSVSATNIQAFEVNGHLEGGSPTNPYTDDVARGLRSIFSWLTTSAVANRSVPTAAPPSCTTPPCTLNPDGNANGYGAYVNQGNPFYQGGMLMDAIVAAGTPSAVTTTGPAPAGANPGILGRTYKDVVQDMVDGYLYCQYFGAGTGGGWRYSCNTFPDNSACQWAAIGIIAAVRGFGAVVPPLAYDWNEIWLNNSQNAASGVFGYTSPGPVWGPYATTPSGMVQLAMDGVGRPDTRWTKAETFIRDNFGNAPTNNNVSIKAYFYGLFSFTKSMLLHAPGGVLTPITLLQSTTSGVTPLDWYAAEVSQGAPTDGVARWLVSQQNPAGYWYNTQEVNTTEQWPFSTGFAIIMLRRTVFIACVNNLQGRGTPAGRAAARVDLTWSGITGADHYNVLRGTVSGGPYVQIGSTPSNVYMDNVGLTSGGTYYYVLQPATSAGGGICQSNEARVTIPAAR